MEILFCEACGRRVSDAELARGEGRKVDNRAWCADCVELAPPAEPAAAPRPHGTVRRPPSGHRRARPATPARPGAPPRPLGRSWRPRTPAGWNSTVLAVCGVVGVGVGLVVGAVATTRGKGRGRSKGAPQLAARPSEPAPPVEREAPAGNADAKALPHQSVPSETPAAAPSPRDDATASESEQSGARAGDDVFARISLDAAFDYVRARPDDTAGQVDRFERVVRNHPGTLAARRAAEQVRKLRAAHPGRFSDEAKVEPFKLPEAEIVDCPRRASPVTVDGRLDEWKELPRECRRPRQIKIKAESWTGPEDCSFRFAVEYDDEYLYIAVETVDEQFFQESPDTYPWRQDGIEIRLDARPDPLRSLGRGRERVTSDSFSASHLFVSLSPSGTADEVHAFLKDTWHAGTRAVCVRTSKGHDTEVAIPVAYLDEKQRHRWQEFRFNVAVDDYDPLPDGGSVGAQIWWRPDWRTDMNVPGSGTFRRR